MSTLGELPLRERKYARTKLALFNAAIKRLVHRPFEAISVRELCDEAMVSEATFFNYFPKKTDLLVYFVQLWVIEVVGHARDVSNGASGLENIEAVFDYTGARSSQRPRVMAEIIGLMAKQREDIVFRPVSLAERLTAFPDLADVGGLPDEPMDPIFRPGLESAKASGELPPDADLDAAMVALTSIFFGVPLALGMERANEVRSTYLNQVRLLWAGLRTGLPR